MRRTVNRRFRSNFHTLNQLIPRRLCIYLIEDFFCFLLWFDERSNYFVENKTIHSQNQFQINKIDNEGAEEEEDEIRSVEKTITKRKT